MNPACVTGDATQANAWAAALGDDRGQLLFTDPPYCLLTRRRKGGDARAPKGRKNEGPEVRRFESVRAYRDFTRAWLTLAAERLEPSAPWVIWTNLLGRAPITEVARELGHAAVWGEFVWAKRTREAYSGEELLRMVETALVLGAAPLPPRDLAAPALPWAAVAGYDDEGETATWGSHPNHKPFGVLEPLLRTWSAPGQCVVDPFAGSGSIPAAALRLGRRVACIEISAEWSKRVSARMA